MSHAGEQGFAEDHGIFSNLADEGNIVSTLDMEKGLGDGRYGEILKSETQSIGIKRRDHESTYVDVQ